MLLVNNGEYFVVDCFVAKHLQKSCLTVPEPTASHVESPPHVAASAATTEISSWVGLWLCLYRSDGSSRLEPFPLQSLLSLLLQVYQRGKIWYPSKISQFHQNNLKVLYEYCYTIQQASKISSGVLHLYCSHARPHERGKTVSSLQMAAV